MSDNNDNLKRTDPEPASATHIYVGNMPYTAQRRDVEELFEQVGIQMYVCSSVAIRDHPGSH
jgi:RNA recognition motif-containing protein